MIVGIVAGGGALSGCGDLGPGGVLGVGGDEGVEGDLGDAGESWGGEYFLMVDKSVLVPVVFSSALVVVGRSG